MDKKLVGLLGAVTSLTAAVPSQAAPRAPITAENLLEVSSYADLLRPIPNAVAVLKSANQARAAERQASAGDAMLHEAQYFYHHHHHHHNFYPSPYYRRPYLPPGYYAPGYYPPAYYPRPFYHHHHHHHHHHHNQFRRGEY